MLGYILALFLAFLSFEYAYYIIAKKLRIVDRPHHQSSHRGAVVRGGGSIFYFSFFLWSLYAGLPYVWTFIGLTLLAGISFFDDVRNVSPKVRLICQFVAIIMMLYQTPLFGQSFHVVILLAIACVGIINIYNFMDGINGMTGGYSLVVSLALLWVNEYEVHFIDSDLLLFVIVAIIVFCLFNFRKRAWCFAGDVGSLSIGFILVFLVLELALKAKSMSWMVFLVVYGVDGGMTILHRLLLHENLMKPHKKHVYQIMANELKIPHLLVSVSYMVLQAVCCVLFIVWPNYYTFFAEIIILMGAYMLFMREYYHLHRVSR